MMVCGAVCATTMDFLVCVCVCRADTWTPLRSHVTNRGPQIFFIARVQESNGVSSAATGTGCGFAWLGVGARAARLHLWHALQAALLQRLFNCCTAVQDHLMVHSGIKIKLR